MPAKEENDEGQAQPENHSQTVRHLYPNAMEVEGEPLSPDNTSGWLLSHKKLSRRELEKLNLTLEKTTAGRHGQATGQAADNILRASLKQNTFVISTPSVTRAEAYAKIRELPVGGASYEAMAYATPPDKTSRGVIRNIPDYDTPEDITRSLEYKKNSTILQARRLGKSSSVIILFEGGKKKHEICKTCGKVGHRTDVCPKPDTTYCKVRGMQKPPENHACEPKCALCSKGHPTSDKKCHQRFQTPHLLRRRQDNNRTAKSENAKEARQRWGGTDPCPSPVYPAVETPSRGPRAAKTRDSRDKTFTPAGTRARRADQPEPGIRGVHPGRVRPTTITVTAAPARLPKEQITSANAQASEPREEQTPRSEAPAREHNRSLGEDSNPPRKQAKEEREPITLEETVERKLENFGKTIRTKMKVAIPEAIGAMQEVLNRPLAGMSDRFSQIETTVSQMSSKMSQMEAALMEKKLKHSKPYDRHRSKDTLRTDDYNHHAVADN
ncbi:hypothetical protein HPB47_001180 [Ixodes persulcatus]|uniref:Uncharacterized protein n=1 Tax=Ixodes persulcatus TaxID=34615 RepID=A0AC60PPU8_IXOPE|nr:hypothetical protein HPB47_001180 [Ixodes persulcatus]